MMSRMIWAVFLTCWPVAAIGQSLTITVAPDPNSVQPGSILSFSAVVPKVADAEETYALWCTEPSKCGHETQSPTKVTTTALVKQTLTFASYTVPSWMKPGTQLCFTVGVPGVYVKNPYGSEPMKVKSPKIVASSCRQVAAPMVTAQGATTAGATSQATSTSRLAIPGGRKATARGASLTTTARSTVGGLPDLIVSYEPAPVARWIVRNIGSAKSVPTHLKFERLNMPGSQFKYVTWLMPGDSAIIAVTPDLDAYLVNSTLTVDPDAKIKELDETNNRWTSASSR